ncbi:protocatechuate 3,4-dioxygenase subunit alpha [Pseudoroseomonas cervicalis]|uniref:protocatechuate 3,4-dioxygenase subunit alpha n=1 Tax=Teichococcus cervicalis TaxID=204525 RepID=UPI00278289BD|nr:protocatechuate 3,4-dioxygenase subunit alpha [Pseudoroseomonas cervicalis]MDQ1080198.1 protocatechuate 3,4-dioxygenase alpha subunit [Pseudoroseomonas cervicalis]
MPVQHLQETPSQTGGPYVHIGTLPAFAGLEIRTQEQPHLITGPGERIRIEGVVIDGSGHMVRDALLELWQADAEGRHNAQGFSGWGRAAADAATGEWFFETIRPGAVPWRDGRKQAPHVSLLVFARGINIHLHTRMYFPEDAAALEADPVLRCVEQVGRRATLIGRKVEGQGLPTYRFEIRLQGEGETVFFDM